MSASKEGNLTSHAQLSYQVFGEILDSIIVDVASESHRIAKLGLDRNLDEEEEEFRLSVQARASVAEASNSGEMTSKYVVDIFGNTHPPVASDLLPCMNCGRTVMAGKFAPHLEKCMGKGRKARLKATRSTTAALNRNARASPYSNPGSVIRVANGSLHHPTGDDLSNGTLEDH